MSCQLTDFAVINQIVTGIDTLSNSFNCNEKWLSGGFILRSIDDRLRLGKKLVAMNANAYLARYGKKGVKWIKANYNRKVYELFFNRTKQITKTQLYSLLQYYIYQCEEFETEPELLSDLKQLKNRLACYILEQTEDYKNVLWGCAV